MALAQDSFAIEGFGGEFTEYKIILESLELNNGQLRAELTLIRIGNSAIIDSATQSLFINGTKVDEDNTSPFSGNGSPATLTGPSNGGEDVIIEFHTDQWGGHTVTFEATAPLPELTGDDLNYREFDITIEKGLIRAEYNIVNNTGYRVTFDVTLESNGIELDRRSHTLDDGFQVSSEMRGEPDVNPGGSEEREICSNIVGVEIV